MDKIGKPHGLIRYTSLDALEGVPHIPLIKRPRVLVYLVILMLAVAGILYGLTHLGSLELKVIHSRSPLFVQMSDGTIQNKYDIKILNKLDNDVEVSISASGPEGLQLIDGEKTLTLKSGGLTSRIMYIKVPMKSLTDSRMALTIKVQDISDPKISVSYSSAFFSPR
jgi:polyferredoxin